MTSFEQSDLLSTSQEFGSLPNAENMRHGAALRQHKCNMNRWVLLGQWPKTQIAIWIHFVDFGRWSMMQGDHFSQTLLLLNGIDVVQCFCNVSTAPCEQDMEKKLYIYSYIYICVYIYVYIYAYKKKIVMESRKVKNWSNNPGGIWLAFYLSSCVFNAAPLLFQCFLVGMLHYVTLALS